MLHGLTDIVDTPIEGAKPEDELHDAYPQSNIAGINALMHQTFIEDDKPYLLSSANLLKLPNQGGARVSLVVLKHII